MKSTTPLQIDTFLSDAHRYFQKKYNMDLKSVLNDPKLTVREKHAQLTSQLKTSLLQQNPGLTAAETNVIPDQYCPIIWLDNETATAWAQETGSGIEGVISSANAILGLVETEDSSSSELVVTAAVTGIIAVGMAWITKGALAYVAITGAATAAAATEAAVVGATVASISAAAEAAAITAATNAGIALATATEVGTAIGATVGGAATAGTMSSFTAFLTCTASLIATPVGAVVLVALLAAVIVALALWLSNLPRSLSGVIINNSDYAMPLYGGSATTTGIYMEEGEMSYFPAVQDDSDPNNIIFQYAGMPARELVEDTTEYMIPAGLFISDKNASGQGVSGYFSMGPANAAIVGLFSNRATSNYPTGVYFAPDPLTDSAETVYERYYKQIEVTAPNIFSGQYSLNAAVNSAHGADAYAVYYIGNSTTV